MFHGRVIHWPERYHPERAPVHVRNELAIAAPPETVWAWLIRSEVREHGAPERLAWDAHGLGVDAYHAWWIERRPGGCHIVTEETQYGFAARLGALVMPRRMFEGHELWLARLAAQAATGPPGRSAGRA